MICQIVLQLLQLKHTQRREWDDYLAFSEDAQQQFSELLSTMLLTSSTNIINSV